MTTRRRRKPGRGRDRNGTDPWGDGSDWTFNDFLPAWTLPEGEKLNTSQPALFSTELNGQSQLFLPIYVSNDGVADGFDRIVLALDSEDTDVGFSQETYVLKESWDTIAGDAPLFSETRALDETDPDDFALLTDYRSKTFLVNSTSRPFDTPKLLAGGTFREATVIIEDAQSPAPIQFGAGNDVVPNSEIANTNGINIIYAGAGDDRVDAGAGNDVVRGEDGNDILQGGSGGDSLFGEAGNDWLRGGAGEAIDYLNGGSGNDRLFGEGARDILDGMGGDDILYGDHENASFDNSNPGNSSDEWDLLFGGSGNDFLHGGADKDFLLGDAGNDYLTGGIGVDFEPDNFYRDQLTGGEGADRFDFYQVENANVDVITDFEITEDKIGIYLGSGSNFLGAGLPLNTSITAAQFHVGTAAADAFDRFIYSNGNLFFDPDGISAAPQTQIAFVSSGNATTPILNHTHILTFDDTNRLPAPSSPPPPPPLVQFSQATYQANENGGNSTITLTRSNRADGVSQVQVNVAGGTANNSDYDASRFPTIVTFGIGETRKTIDIPILQDRRKERTESLNLQLNSVNNPTVGTIETAIGRRTAKLEILDDDRPITITGTRRKDRLIGNELDNVIIGLGNDDFLSGENGRDRLFGGKGSDVLKGGTGKDIFALETGIGRDLIQDFRDRQDKLGLTGGIKFRQLRITQQDQNTLIRIGGDQLVLLTNVRSNLITQADFVSL